MNLAIRVTHVIELTSHELNIVARALRSALRDDEVEEAAALGANMQGHRVEELRHLNREAEKLADNLAKAYST